LWSVNVEAEYLEEGQLVRSAIALDLVASPT
jgi:hypothetical protein